MPKAIPIEEEIGKRYGRLVVVRDAGVKKLKRQSSRLCECLCDCGKSKVLHLTALRAGRVFSCGCSRKKHGEGLAGCRTKEYLIWGSIISRCCNPKHKAYRLYGGRGISICGRWRKDFSAFLSDMGRKPGPKFSIERKNNDLGYSPDNCKWATTVEQSNNRRTNIKFEMNGESKTLAEWSRSSGVGVSTLRLRVRRKGWSLETAISTPVK